VSAPDEDSGGQLPSTTELTRRILEEVRPYINPNKMRQAEEHLGSVVVQELYQEFHQGPLPSPRQLSGYEKVLPGSAERIMKMAEKEQDHRQGCENRLIGAEISLKHIGQGLAFLALIVMIGLLGYMTWTGAAGPAATLGGVMVAAVVGAFLAPKFFHRPAERAAPPAQNPRRKKRR
jgi:uncharacterized membrane protein